MAGLLPQPRLQGDILIELAWGHSHGVPTRVISDIDDTVKITEVRDRHAMLRNTFLREFQPVPGMADFYQTLARSNGAAFHYTPHSFDKI